MNQKTLAVKTVTIDCKIDVLDVVVSEIEKEEGFHKWAKPPLEQLDGALGAMVDPNQDTIPPCLIYYMCYVDSVEIT